MLLNNKQLDNFLEKYKEMVNFYKNDIGLEPLQAVINAKDIFSIDSLNERNEQNFIKVVNTEGEDVFIDRYAIDGFTMSVNKTHDKKELVIFLGYNHYIICPEDQYKSFRDQLGVDYEEDN